MPIRKRTLKTGLIQQYHRVDGTTLIHDTYDGTGLDMFNRIVIDGPGPQGGEWARETGQWTVYPDWPISDFVHRVEPTLAPTKRIAVGYADGMLDDLRDRDDKLILKTYGKDVLEWFYRRWRGLKVPLIENLDMAEKNGMSRRANLRNDNWNNDVLDDFQPIRGREKR